MGEAEGIEPDEWPEGWYDYPGDAEEALDEWGDELALELADDRS